jgi:hypothetical protein
MVGFTMEQEMRKSFILWGHMIMKYKLDIPLLRDT